MEKLIVTSKYNNKKLNKFVLDNLPYLSSNSFYKLLRKKDIKINGTRVCENVLLNFNDEVLVYVPDNLKKEFETLDIIYEDENILLINKPANIEVVGSNSLTSTVHKKYINCEFLPMPCHRIDRNTTGLVLFAKNPTSLEIIENKFKNHEIKKYYKALVYGIPKIKQAKLEAYLFKDRKNSMVYVYDEPKKGCKKIVTYYNVVCSHKNNNTSLLDVEIQTGRTHQIRAHLAHIGYPIIGDGKYGINQINKQFGVKYQQLCHYKLEFVFNSDGGILNYLNGKSFEEKINFTILP